MRLRRCQTGDWGPRSSISSLIEIVAEGSASRAASVIWEDGICTTKIHRW
jgi:hypothetical protein